MSNEDFCLSTSDWQCLYSGTQNFVCNKDCCITTLDTELDWHPLYSWHPNYGSNVAVVFCILSSIFLVLQHFLYKYWPTGTKGAQKQMPGLTRGGTRGEWLPAHISSQTPPVQSVVSSWEEARRRRRRRDPAWGWGGGSAACAGGFKAAGDLPNWKASRWGVSLKPDAGLVGPEAGGAWNQLYALRLGGQFRRHRWGAYPTRAMTSHPDF